MEADMHKENQNSNQETIGSVILDLKKYQGQDLYCDGPVEDEILEIVKNYTAKEFNKIIAERKSWPILYHLSHIRSNIIEPIPINNTHRVLEIGSGCGAITGRLAQKAERVDCIELSKKRSLINAYRNQEKNNINIYVGNFQDIEKDITEKYDYITLIGVFEYAAMYIQSENPYQEFLKIIAKHLKPNGKLVIAIENKLGLKYFSGRKEDHTNLYFEGIMGYPNTEGIRTFVRNELEEMAKIAGFLEIECYYPFPDYKFPQAIYTDDWLPQKTELADWGFNFDFDKLKLFDEDKALETVVNAGVFSTFSNSYLMFLGRNTD